MNNELTEARDRLLEVFPDSYINGGGEFIAHRKTNQYFILKNCETLLDVKCKVLEWLSRAAYKTTYYAQEWRNQVIHRFILDGINDFLETDFDENDMEIIYIYLGNCCNHDKTIRFIESDYDMALLEG